jgi:hypothetical protein
MVMPTVVTINHPDHPGSVRVREGADFTAPVLQDPMDAETGFEIDR